MSTPSSVGASVVAVLALAAALVTAPWHGHIDDADAQLYQVTARGMAATGKWMDPAYLPAVHAQYREHLPFGLWPLAAAVRLFGEGALPAVGALWTLATVALVGWLGTRLNGRGTGLLAMLVLATTETFFLYGGRARLDPPLLFFATLAATPVLFSRPGARGWILAAVAGALAVLIKGPFGVVPLAGAVVARAALDRSPRHLALGICAGVASLIPLIVFLALDRLASSGTWWNGYLHGQLLASATGVRADGTSTFLFPLKSIAGRFWPGLPLCVLGVAVALGIQLPRRLAGTSPASVGPAIPARVVTVASLLVVLALCLPGRKVWNHELVAYPLLAVQAAIALGGPLGRLFESPRARHALAVALLAAAVGAWAASLAGLGARLLPPPCVPSHELSSFFDRLAPGTPILVVSRAPHWGIIASLAAERRLVPWPVDQVPAGQTPLDAHLALAELGFVTPNDAPWREASRARGWVLLERP